MNNNKKNLKWIVILLSIFLAFSLNAQDKEIKNHFRISLTNTNYLPLQIKTQGVKLLESQISPSGELGLTYSRTLPHLWGLEVGAAYSQMPYHFFFNFYSELENVNIPNLEDRFHRLTLFEASSSRLSIKISTFKDLTLAKNHFIRTQLGMNIDFSLAQSVTSQLVYEGSNNIDNRLFSSYLESFIPISTSFSFTGKIGIKKQFKNQDYFLVSLVGCYAPTALLNGTFEFYNIDYESKGTLKFRPSYVGLEFSYAFALKKKSERVKKDSLDLN